MIKFNYKFLKIYTKIRQKGEENETMVRDHQKCHHVVAAWTVSYNPYVIVSGSLLALCLENRSRGLDFHPRFFLWSGRLRNGSLETLYIRDRERKERGKEEADFL